MHSGSLFHFLHHCRIGDFRRFISNSHTSNDQFDDTWRNDSRRQENPIQGCQYSLCGIQCKVSPVDNGQQTVSQQGRTQRSSQAACEDFYLQIPPLWKGMR